MGRGENYSIEGDLTNMGHGDVRAFAPGSTDAAQKRSYKVSYSAEQAMGDNNRPAKGYTVGHYHVQDPEGNVTSFRHTPHGPTLMGAKGYAARQAAEHVTKKLREDQGRVVHPRSGRLGLNSDDWSV